MHCPFCNAQDTKVIDSRLAAEGAQVRRRRQCLECNERFTELSEEAFAESCEANNYEFLSNGTLFN